MSRRPPLRLPLAPGAEGESSSQAPGGGRHPQDGWQLADPLPIGKGSRKRLRAVVEALLPPPPAPRPEGMEDRIIEHTLRVIRYFPRLVGAVVLPLLLLLLEWSPLWYRARPRRLSGLPVAARSALLARLATSRFEPLRLLLLVPKALVLSTYFDQDEVHQALEYEPRAFVGDRRALRDELRPVLRKATP
jgi:hypothetical protein